MRIAILTTGTRGDLQPYLALALGLQAKGHDVVLCGPENFAEWVIGHGIEFVPGGIDIQALLQSPEGREMVAGNPIAIIRNFRDIGTKLMAGTIDASTQAAKGADLILYHPKVPIAVDLAEAWNIPIAATALQPILVPTAAFPLLVFGAKSLGARLNRWSYILLRGQRVVFAKQLNKWRTEVLDLPPLGRFANAAVLNGKPIPVIHAISEAIIPRPDDWPEYAHLSGYWFLKDQSGWMPSPEFQTFLDAGAPPVYVGFGSMTDKDPAAKARITIDALERANCRGVIATGWGGLDTAELPDTVFQIDSAPHDKLFPLMSAVVHHGGAGTTAAAFQAGKPQIVVPYFGDQPYWGARVEGLGVGPPPLPQKRITAKKLARAIRAAVRDKNMSSHAETIAHQLATEDGVSKAITIIEGYGE
jgi:sterol 3beta-glucosyltransferase